MKKDVDGFVYSYLTCQKSEIEHQKAIVMMQSLNIPECKWDNVYMDFVRLHGIPLSIVPDRDLTFTSRFWDCVWN